MDFFLGVQLHFTIDPSEMIKEIWPFIGVAIAVLLLITYVPGFSTFIPNLMYGVD